MKKYIKIIILIIMIIAGLGIMTGCTQVNRVSSNLGKDADNFNIARRIVVYNARTDKIKFANSICSNDKNLSYANMTECERYGITWGCDKDCPVFKRKECELQEENEKLFNKVVE